MDTERRPGTGLSRRTFLGGVAGGLAAGTLTGTARAASTRPTVATRNLYLGANLFRLFRAESFADLRTIVGELLADIGRTCFAQRADAIADELATTKPHLVGLQEAALVRTQRPSDYAETATPDATNVRYDHLETLRSAIDARGLDYDVVAVGRNADFELPADVDGDRIDVRLTDRDVVLARGDVETASPRTHTYGTTLTLPIDSRTVSIDRGYARVTATVGGETFSFVNTHLESAAADVRDAQARELRDRLPADERVVLVGDFNSGPDASSAAYSRLAETYRDAGGGVGPTCCQAGTLRNPESKLDSRIDHVFTRGFAPVSATRVGAESSDRIEATVDGQSVRLWPSDHAGVVATLEPTALPTPTTTAESTAVASPVAEATQTPTPTPSATATSLPGLGVGVGAAALALSAYLARRSGD